MVPELRFQVRLIQWQEKPELLRSVKMEIQYIPGLVGFSNVDNPELAISVCVEDADTATITGVSVAKQVFDSYYNN